MTGRFINIRGQLLDLSTPQVMGILNVTPDSFYAASRKQSEREIAERAIQIAEEGAAFIDLGGCSTRPGAASVTEEEEAERLRTALEIVRRECPDMPLSVDTFRANIAAKCVEEWGADLINDISGGEIDAQMFPTVARLGVPYILMHIQGTPQTMQNAPRYDNLMEEVCLYFAAKIDALHALGVKDILLDPGFGFGKTLEHNYELLARLEEFPPLFGLPLLVGVSRKSMVYKLLGCTPDEALNGTTVLHTIALLKGASILRTHDVKEAAEAVRIVETMRRQIHS